MTIFQSFILLLSLTGLFSYINYRFLKLPSTIGMTLLAITMAVPIGLLEIFNPELFHQTCALVTKLDFKTLLLNIMLSLLLFAGAVHIQLKDLSKERKSIISYATLGVVLSTLIIGTLTYFISGLIGYPIPLEYSLVFGALISPTDPIAALAILKEIGVKKNLESKIAGESLFNDGVGVVVFVALLGFTTMSGEGVSFLEIGQLFVEEAIGGLVMGILLGFTGFWLLRSVSENPKIMVMLTLVVSLGGYALCSLIHVSGPLAMVVTSLIIGNRIRNSESFNKDGKFQLNIFWEILDDMMNSILFVLIGLEVLVLSFEYEYALLSVFAILIILIARYVSVWIANKAFPDHEDDSPRKSILILTWGGLRGGISVALALSLPVSPYREYLIFITYVVVVFSIIVQGLTIKPFAKKLKITANPN